LKYLMGRARLTEVDLAGNEKVAVSGPLHFTPWQVKSVCIQPLR